MEPKLLILDFDGTLCLGDDPVLAYAAQVDEELTTRGLNGPGGRPVRDLVADAFAADTLLVEEINYDDDGVPLAVKQEARMGAAGAHPTSWPLQDGYQLVQLLGVQAGLSGQTCGEAFRAARRTLLGAGLENTDLHAPAEAPELLSRLRQEGVVVVLATNSPAEGFDTWLQTLGLEAAFDAVINSAQKPFGMPATVEQARQTAAELRGGAQVAAGSILSVGDIWANDLDYVAEQGGVTVLIDRFTTGLGEPSHRVQSFTEAADLIGQWGQK